MKKPTFRSLKAKAWKIFSEWIRRREADEGGTVYCCTCRAPIYWKEAHAGHFVSGRTMSVLFHPDITHPQCVRCNIFLGGNYARYTLYMLDKYGREKVEEFLSLKHKTVKLTRSDLEDIINQYKEKIRCLDGAATSQ